MPHLRRRLVDAMGLIWGEACKPRVWPRGVAIAGPSGEPAAQVRAGLEGVGGDALGLQRPPEPRDEDVVPPPSAPIHADPDAGVLPHGREGKLVNGLS